MSFGVNNLFAKFPDASEKDIDVMLADYKKIYMNFNPESKIQFWIKQNIFELTDYWEKIQSTNNFILIQLYLNEIIKVNEYYSEKIQEQLRKMLE